MKLLSINELADLTSKQRPTISRRVAHLAKKKQGKSVLLPSDLALESIYEVEKRKVAESNSGDKAGATKPKRTLLKSGSARKSAHSGCYQGSRIFGPTGSSAE